MQAFLKKHGPGPAHHQIKVSWTKTPRGLVIDFLVQKRDSSSWVADQAFTQDWSKNWGLWNKDVVEAFLQLRTSPEDLKAPYLEIQVSPLNQPFALIITEPRKTFFVPKELSFETASSIEGKIWTSRMEVELPQELSGSQLFGGFFACLGQEQREYYALNPNEEMNPDFHRPELFFPLDQA